jgi:hypothetical protein
MRRMKTCSVGRSYADILAVLILELVEQFKPQRCEGINVHDFPLPSSQQSIPPKFILKRNMPYATSLCWVLLTRLESWKSV